MQQRTRKGAFAVFVAACLIGAADAAAATRHATPGGSGTACTAATPCSASTAVGAAARGDEVVLAPGTYGSPDARVELRLQASEVLVRGADPAAPPVIFAREGFLVLGGSPKLRDLRVDAPDPHPGVHLAQGGELERLRAKGYQGCETRGAVVLTSTVCTGTHVGLRAEEATLRNVTLTGGQIGVFAHIGLKGTNAILDGGQRDVVVLHSTAELTHSNFDTFARQEPTGANNQKDPPQFDPARPGEWRQLPSSPTVDAGFDDPANGELDDDGQPRRRGERTDIGADELVDGPPLVRTGAATGVTDRTAVLAGEVDPSGRPTSARFEVEGVPTPDQAMGAHPVTFRPVTATVTGLSPGTTYRYRLVATNQRGTAAGQVLRFTTAAAPPPAAAAPLPAPRPPSPPAPALAPAPVVASSTARSCLSRRTLTPTLRPGLDRGLPLPRRGLRGARFISARLHDTRGRRAGRVRLGRRSVRVDFQGLRDGRYTLVTRVRLASGRVITARRTYRTCGANRARR